MIRSLLISATLAATLAVATPALAANRLIVPNVSVAVAKSAMMVTADREWNKLGARPGPLAESWTLDGDVLNRLSFYGGLINGATLFREVDRKNRPLPKVRADMLPTDIPALFEQSYRIAENSGLFSVDSIEPASIGGASGVRFTYSFSKQGEDVARKGEAVAAMVGGKLWLISFEAPTLHYFDAGITSARAIMASVRLPAK
ncbi:MAG: hypothetical protein KGQ52_11965 [Alphaproteobacteria bacterium]|nr:hypothetical protein [Alphaproteobacteria bacterium]